MLSERDEAESVSRLPHFHLNNTHRMDSQKLEHDLPTKPRPASGSLLQCWQPSIFGCWPPGVELPATGGYIGTVSGDLPHLTRDVSVYRIINPDIWLI